MQSSINDALESAMVHQRAGRLDDAQLLYREILNQDPNHSDALHLLGLILIQSNKRQSGIDLIRRAISIRPTFFFYHRNLAVALIESGKMADAIPVLSDAVRLDHQNVEVRFFLGNSLAELEKHDEAISAFREVLKIDPAHADALCNLGKMLIYKGMFDDAVAFCRRAVQLNPTNPRMHLFLGNAYRCKHQVDGAIACYQEAIRLQPDYADGHRNLAAAFEAIGKNIEAMKSNRRAIELKPDYAEAHWCLGMLLLLQGDFEAGWREHEWRWKMNEYAPQVQRFAQPMWAGKDLHGQTILLHPEQGIGDILQFVRYVPLVAARGGTVLLECRHELLRLLDRFPGTHLVIPEGEPLPPFDLHCPLLSLPAAFDTTLDTIPANITYIKADPELAEKWKARLQIPAGQLRVGLVWAGNPIFKGDRDRSTTLGTLAPLAQVAGVTFVSLQKGTAEEEAKKPPTGMRLINLGPELTDFADTAAVLSLLDLVITTDTSVPHLAGAMGRPVWVMLQHAANWRWFLKRDDSPWYPTMRLFRQKALGDWNGLITTVAMELAAFVKERENENIEY